MTKQISHFGQDLDKIEFYNLIVKVTDISSKDQFKDVWNDMIPIGIHLNAGQAWESQLRVKGLADIIIPQHGRKIPAVIG